MDSMYNLCWFAVVAMSHSFAAISQSTTQQQARLSLVVRLKRTLDSDFGQRHFRLAWLLRSNIDPCFLVGRVIQTGWLNDLPFNTLQRPCIAVAACTGRSAEGTYLQHTSLLTASEPACCKKTANLNRPRRVALYNEEILQHTQLCIDAALPAVFQEPCPARLRGSVPQGLQPGL